MTQLRQVMLDELQQPQRTCRLAETLPPSSSMRFSTASRRRCWSGNLLCRQELTHIIRKALEKDRKLRYQSAADLRTDVERLRRDSTDRRPGARAPHRRSRAWLGRTAVALLIVAVATAAFL